MKQAKEPLRTFSRRIQLGSKTVSEKSPCFIIAEAGVNHNGSIDLALKLIDAAATANADAVKFQTFQTANLILEGVDKAAYQKKTTGASESQAAMLRKLELSIEQKAKLKTYAEKKGLVFLTTPFDEESLDLLDPLDLAGIKVASTDLTNVLFLRRIARKGKPIILSTGMSAMKDVRTALTVIKPINRDVMLLQCTGNYPMRDEDANLRVISTYRREFSILTGFSDHSSGIGASPFSIAFGAKVIEKHITLDKTMPGPDHPASLDPSELMTFVRDIRRAEAYLGTAEKKLSPAEHDTRPSLQKCLVAARTIRAGEAFSETNLVAKRTGGRGISAIEGIQLVGKKADRTYEKNEIIQRS